MTRTWYALKCERQKEKLAARILRASGYEASAVVRVELRRRTGRCKTRQPTEIVKAPGYVFAVLPSDDELWKLRRFHLIHGYIACNGRPAHFDARKLERFLRYERPEFADHERFMRTRQTFGVGDVVTALEGPLADHDLKVIDLQGREARVLVKLFGRELDVLVPVIDCQKVA